MVGAPGTLAVRGSGSTRAPHHQPIAREEVRSGLRALFLARGRQREGVVPSSSAATSRMAFGLEKMIVRSLITYLYHTDRSPLLIKVELGEAGQLIVWGALTW